MSIGVFDGVHRGHAELIARAVKAGRERGVPTVLMTFDPHPMEVVFPGSHPAQLTTLPRRAELAEELGIDVREALAWRDEVVDYPHALVRLHFWKVSAWDGELRMLEGQAFSWEQLPVTPAPVLPGTVPVLSWFAQERGFDGPTYRAVEAAS